MGTRLGGRRGSPAGEQRELSRMGAATTMPTHCGQDGRPSPPGSFAPQTEAASCCENQPRRAPHSRPDVVTSSW